MKILLIEDTILLAQTIARYFFGHGISCTIRFDAESGYQELSENAYDLVLLDIELPGASGRDLCHKIREEGNSIPIIMLTSRGTSGDIIGGLDSGADDYITKPFDYNELYSRIRALSRRNMAEKSTSTIRCGDIFLDQRVKRVQYGGRYIDLTPKAYELLLYLLQNRDRIITKRELEEKVWGRYDPWKEQKSVEMYIGQLRKKIHPQIIETMKGFGYRIRY